MPPDGGFFIFLGDADFLIFLALHGSIDGAVYKFVHAFSALCGVIFYQNLAAKTPAFRHGDTAALKEY